jgi:hypothetical protein
MQRGSSTGSGGAASGPSGAQEGPITGGDFQQFSDRLRDVEESLRESSARSLAGQVRDRARSLRAEFKRHSERPNFTLVQQQLIGPLMQLRQQLSQDLARATGDQLAPVDRDPVPAWFTDLVDRYYQSLGSGK